MKKLICAKDMEEVAARGQKTFCVTDEMIMTPSAKDVAKVKSISLVTGNEPAPCVTKEEKSVAKPESKVVFSPEDLDADTILKIFKTIVDKGLVQEMLNCLTQANNLPYEKDADPSGLKVVRGNTVKMDVFDTGDPNVKAFYQELVSKEESKMSAGFLIIDHSRFNWELTYEEIDYVIEGTLTIELNGKTYTAHAGDVLFVPSGSKVVWGSPDKARVFYATYPANWADLL